MARSKRAPESEPLDDAPKAEQAEPRKPANPVSPADVFEHLKITGAGDNTLAMIREWMIQNPQADAEAMLLWAEDQLACDVINDRPVRRTPELGEGTVHKMGVRIIGENYGMRRTGESNSEEISRMREENNELRKQLDIVNRSASNRATVTAAGRKRLDALEAENLSLREQLRPFLMNDEVEAGLAQPEARRQPKPRARTNNAGAMEETAGSLVG